MRKLLFCVCIICCQRRDTTYGVRSEGVDGWRPERVLTVICGKEMNGGVHHFCSFIDSKHLYILSMIILWGIYVPLLPCTCPPTHEHCMIQPFCSTLSSTGSLLCIHTHTAHFMPLSGDLWHTLGCPPLPLDLTEAAWKSCRADPHHPPPSMVLWFLGQILLITSFQKSNLSLRLQRVPCWVFPVNRSVININTGCTPAQDSLKKI